MTCLASHSATFWRHIENVINRRSTENSIQWHEVCQKVLFDKLKMLYQNRYHISSFVRYVKAKEHNVCIEDETGGEISFVSIFCNERKILPQLITLYYLHHFVAASSSIYCSCISSYTNTTIKYTSVFLYLLARKRRSNTRL